MSTIAVRTLACGLPLVTEVMPGMRSAALAWLVPAGIATEPADRGGIASMWAELLMRGAGNLDSRAQADAFDRLGASRGCSAATYHLSLSATTVGERLPDVLPLLVDMLRKPRFDGESIEPTRDLALQALESLKDDPNQRAGLAAKARHYAPPINRSPLGTHEGISLTTRADLLGGWLERSRPGGSILSVAGAINPDALASQLDALLQGWTGSCVEPATTGQAPRGYAHITDASNQVQIIILHDGPHEAHPDSILEKVVISVLSGGMAGRLFTEVREKRGLCYSVSAGYSGSKRFGTVQAYVGTTPERAQESLDVLLAELHRINEGNVTAEELQRAIVGMKSRLIFAGESTPARAGALAGDMHRLGHPRSLADHAAAIDTVTLDRVNDYLKRRSLGRMTIQTLGPAPLSPPQS